MSDKNFIVFGGGGDFPSRRFGRLDYGSGHGGGWGHGGRADLQIVTQRAQQESGAKMETKTHMQSRRQGALLGMFVGDALAMPVHWYYDRVALERDYGKVCGYMAPIDPHPDSILWRSSYTALDGSADILHDQRPYWGRPGIHYHQFLKAGENTLNLKLCQLLIHQLSENGCYDADAYLDRYIEFMTTPGNHRDTYVEEYHRHFFTKYALGNPPRRCGVVEKHISGLIGMIPLMVYYADDPETAGKLAFEHLRLTHLGDRMTAAGRLLVDILLPVINGEQLVEVIDRKIKRQDTPLMGHPFKKWLDEPDDKVVGRHVSSACYVEDAVPAAIYLALKYHDDLAGGLIANTNLGGDNAGRGAVLGALLGAANGHRAFPQPWVEGLRQPPTNLSPIKRDPMHTTTIDRKDKIMNSEKTENVYVRVKDMAGNDFVCPLNELKDPSSISAAESENCFEGDVVGRYAGMLKIVDSEA